MPITDHARTHLQVAILRAKTDGFRFYAAALQRMYADLYGKQNSRLTGKEKGCKVRIAARPGGVITSEAGSQTSK